jgi:hypothetical protein
MGSVTSEFGGPFRVVYFSDDSPASNATWLVAAVVWRVASESQAAGWRSVLHRYRYRVGLRQLTAKFHLGRDAGLWNRSAGLHGEQETLFHVRRRVVRVLGREYPLPPDGRTLVLLIDEAGNGRAAPSVTLRTMTAPMLARPSMDHRLEPTGERLPYDGFVEQKVWAAALRSDPEVRVFMAGRPNGGAA